MCVGNAVVVLSQAGNGTPAPRRCAWGGSFIETAWVDGVSSLFWNSLEADTFPGHLSLGCPPIEGGSLLLSQEAGREAPMKKPWKNKTAFIGNLFTSN